MLDVSKTVLQEIHSAPPDLWVGRGSEEAARSFSGDPSAGSIFEVFTFYVTLVVVP